MNGLIAIIEDEEDMLELLEYNLQKEGFETVGFVTPKNIEQLLKEEPVDLLIVDRNLPYIEGSDLVRDLRERGYSVPVIFVTAKDSEQDRINGFVKGGDDYITKPFNMSELVLRVKALLKRTKVSELDVIQYKDITIKPKSREVFVNDESIALTKLEFDLLVEFVNNRNIVLTRDYLLEHVWRHEHEYQDRTVNVAIKRLRDKIDPEKKRGYIKSSRGEGYIFC